MLHSRADHKIPHACSHLIVFSGQEERFPYEEIRVAISGEINLSKMTVNSASQQTSHNHYCRFDTSHADHLISELNPNRHLNPQRVTVRHLSADKKSGVIDDRQTMVKKMVSNSKIAIRVMSIIFQFIESTRLCSRN